MIYSLRRRLSLAMLGLVAATSIAFAFFIGASSEQLEMELLNTLSSREIDLLAVRLSEDPATPLPQLANTHVWLDRPGGTTTPEPFRDLPAGISHNVHFGGDAYHVQRQPIGDNVLTVALEINAIEKREARLVLLLALGVTASCVLAVGLAIWISRRLTRPITRLADVVTDLQPGADTAPIAPRFEGLEVDLIAGAIDRFMGELRTYIRRERTFAAAASHELRSPLTVLRNAMELVALDPDLSPRTHATAQRALRNAELLSKLVDGLLLLARTNTDDRQLAPIDAGAVVAEVIAAHAALAQTHDVKVDLQYDPALPPRLVAPESHLAIVTGNLLRNAIAVSSGGTVRVDLSPGQLRVHDSGPGLSSEDFKRYLHPFERNADSTGVGLGLYITAEIAGRHQWQLSCARTDTGSCVTCSFPPPARRP